MFSRDCVSISYGSLKTTIKNIILRILYNEYHLPAINCVRIDPFHCLILYFVNIQMDFQQVENFN